MSKVVGIDLGTTNSVVAVVEGGEPVVITNREGSRLTPSVVAFTKDGQRLVGQPAKNQAILNPERTVRSIKRKMGTREKITIDGKDYTPEQISAMILQKLKGDAEAYLGEPVTQAVITVPAYFDDAQRTATKNAGEIAGLEVLRIINEPTAAALAYGLDKKKDETILVYDLGGGTFDVSLLEVGEGVFEVKATAGNTHLGGDDMDERVMGHLADEFQKQNGIDLRQDPQALQRLKEHGERAKIELSSTIQTNLNLPFITSTSEGPRHLDATLTRAKLEELVADLVDKTTGPFRRALEDANVAPPQIDEVILVGGATRMPMVQELVRRLTGKEAHKGVNPDEVVAVGAAIQASVLAGEMDDIVLLDVTPLTLGVETLGAVFTRLIERNTTIPTRKSDIFTTAQDGQTSVEVHVLQGERDMAAHNKSLARFHLTGIPPAPRGIPQIEVTFDIDANGILNVGAKDLATGNEQKVTVTGSSNLGRDEIDRMMKEAEQHAEEDRRQREVAEARNRADALVYQTEKALREAGDKVPAEQKASVQAQIDKVKEAMKGSEVQAINAACCNSSQATYRIFESVYRETAQRQAAAGQPQPEPGAAAGGGDEVIDAEFKAEG